VEAQDLGVGVPEVHISEHGKRSEGNAGAARLYNVWPYRTMGTKDNFGSGTKIWR